ncbi:hypothetical protein AgCh_033900 [Apium graveolens]
MKNEYGNKGGEESGYPISVKLLEGFDLTGTTRESAKCSECQSEEIQPSAGKRRDETTAKGTGLAESAGKEDPVELDSSATL